ncbi:MAG: lamin tail domain-containing protein [Methanotrichaceae archaeon]
MRTRSSAIYYLLFVMAIVATAAGSVVINEMELNPPDGGSDWVELYNSGNNGVDISNWSATITDGGWVGKMSVPKGTIISPKGFYVLNGNPQWNHDNGGFVTLYSESGVVIDKTPYRTDPLHNDLTWGRHPDGHNTNTDGDWGFAYATKGRSNQI